eukprot:TRINITY_DN39806_c1_g1_i1.p1 TRINITY_DN39806_c1_g1~~TRINITY_DN39806_c1_g1_i1.p1  ORF type:complete len:1328 (-),score=266.44 TRINITY_DN39806_c1_g1_i1:295-4278(-)
MARPQRQQQNRGAAFTRPGQRPVSAAQGKPTTCASVRARETAAACGLSCGATTAGTGAADISPRQPGCTPRGEMAGTWQKRAAGSRQSPVQAVTALMLQLSPGTDGPSACSSFLGNDGWFTAKGGWENFDSVPLVDMQRKSPAAGRHGSDGAQSARPLSPSRAAMGLPKLGGGPVRAQHGKITRAAVDLAAEVLARAAAQGISVDALTGAASTATPSRPSSQRAPRPQSAAAGRVGRARSAVEDPQSAMTSSPGQRRPDSPTPPPAGSHSPSLGPNISPTSPSPQCTQQQQQAGQQRLARRPSSALAGSSRQVSGGGSSAAGVASSALGSSSAVASSPPTSPPPAHGLLQDLDMQRSMSGVFATHSSPTSPAAAPSPHGVYSFERSPQSPGAPTSGMRSRPRQSSVLGANGTPPPPKPSSGLAAESTPTHDETPQALQLLKRANTTSLATVGHVYDDGDDAFSSDAEEFGTTPSTQRPSRGSTMPAWRRCASSDAVMDGQAPQRDASKNSVTFEGGSLQQVLPQNLTLQSSRHEWRADTLHSQKTTASKNTTLTRGGKTGCDAPVRERFIPILPPLRNGFRSENGDAYTSENSDVDLMAMAGRRNSSRAAYGGRRTSASARFARRSDTKREALLTTFHRLARDGEIHRQRLFEALEVSGVHCPMQPWIDDTFQSMSGYQSLDCDEFMNFVEAYKVRHHDEVTEAFRKHCDEDGGEIDAADLRELLKNLGMTPMEDVLEEIIQEVDDNGTGALDFEEFEAVLALIFRREGFCKREFDRLVGAFVVFDADNSNTLDTHEVASALRYLNYHLDQETCHRIVQEVDIDGSGALNKKEFLVFMRKVREYELGKIQAELERVVDDPAAAKQIRSQKEWFDLLLQRLGYFPSSHAVWEIGEDVHLDLQPREDGAPVAAPSLQEAWRFLEVLRSREGMTRAEVKELEVVFQDFITRGGEHDKLPNAHMHQVWISPLDAALALRWLGYAAPREVQRNLIEMVDVDGSGKIGFADFRKLVKRCQERELNEVLSCLEQLKANWVHEIEDMWLPDCSAKEGVALSPVEAKRTLEFLGCTVTENGNLQINGIPDPGSLHGDAHAVVHAALQYRAEVRASHRKNLGFSPRETEELEAHFGEYDPKGLGSITRGDLRQLVQEIFPEKAASSSSRPELVKLLKEVVPNGDDRVVFKDFLHLVNSISEMTQREAHVKEKTAVRQCDFSPVQVREFREVFIQEDERRKDALTFSQLKDLLQRSLMPLGDRLLMELTCVWRKVLGPRYVGLFDEEEDDTDKIPDVGEADFAEFLRIMFILMESNFGGIRTRFTRFDRLQSGLSVTG